MAFYTLNQAHQERGDGWKVSPGLATFGGPAVVRCGSRRLCAKLF